MKEMNDPEIDNLINKELIRQKEVLNMIPSENYVSKNVLKACGTVLMNKYSEGYPYKRYYQGNEFVDDIEQIAINRAKLLFNAEHANVQPLSGSPANFAIFLAFLKPGDKFLGLDLSCGGHLTHGSHVNFSGKIYNCASYGVDKDTELLDMNEIRTIAKKEMPKMIISGLTAYPRNIDFKAFQEIAQEVGAIHLADISHIAGLVAAGVVSSPLPFTDIVSTTTHKTLRGPRGALILSKEIYAKEIDKAVFPGSQGGPHENVIAAKAICFKEAMSDEYKEYAHQIIKNAKILAETLMNNDIKLVTNGTDNHLILINLLQFGTGMGKEIAVSLEKAGICLNANTVPYDPSTPFKPSGLRLGTPILTTRGMKENEMKIIGDFISRIIKDPNNPVLQKTINKQIKELCSQFPVYEDL
ncbi:serine hydroxymethyltransferase [Candidatus Pacearchaeota archaeon]|nr:serine hydroxymethyltransferase [Candidatus Pacearchaeota archaeon]